MLVLTKSYDIYNAKSHDNVKLVNHAMAEHACRHMHTHHHHHVQLYLIMHNTLHNIVELLQQYSCDCETCAQ